MRNTAQQTRGFTLIEMSIVLVIIGLIVGGILTGVTMVNSATAQSQIKQIQDLQVQITTFKTKYDCLPGDCPNATGFLGTTYSGNTVVNGNGDSIITNTTVGQLSTASNTVNSSLAGEDIQVFLQLDAAGMGNYNSDGATYAGDGNGIPFAAVNNGTSVFVVYSLGFGRQFDGNHMIVVGVWPSVADGTGRGRLLYDTRVYSPGVYGGPYYHNNTGIPVKYAQAIDRKIDDGMPWYGKYRE